MSHGYRLAARLARREVVRRPGRTILVALLVAVPVMCMTVAAVLVRTDDLTALQDFRLRFGDRADITVSDLRPLTPDVLPPGAHSVRYTENWRLVRTADGDRARTIISDIPLDDPITEGIVRVVDGRVPRAADEVLLSPHTARELGVEVGEELVLERPEPGSFTVVGIGEQRAQLDTPLLVLGPGAAWTSRNPSEAPMELVDLPGTPTDTAVRAVAENITVHGYGGVGDSTKDEEPDDGASAVRWSWVIGAVFLTVIGIVIAAAFAAGARRQLTTLGQLAANGASPRVLRRVLFLQGTWTGCLGAMTGIALGFVALAALRPHIDRIFWRDMGPWDVRISDLIPVVLLGVGAATVAALVPARTTSRVPVLAALSGRRPLGAVPRWLVGAGVTATVCGLGLLGLAVLGSNQPGNSANVWGLTAVVGGVAVLLGACAVAPGFVSTLEPLAGRFHRSWRLAARSLARQRTRTSAVVSAVCATCALAVAASALILSGSAEAADDVPWIRDDFVVMQRMTYSPSTDVTTAEPPDAALVDLVEAELPDSDPTPLRVIDANGLRSGWSLESFRASDGDNVDALELNERDSAIGFADEAMVRAYRMNDETRRALESTGALLFASTDGEATIKQTLADGSTAHIDVAVAGPDDQGLGSLPRLLLTPAKAAELGLASTPGPVVIDAPGMTRDQREAITDVVDEYTEPERISAGGPERISAGGPERIAARGPERIAAGGLEQEIVKGVEGFVNVEFSWPNEDIDPHILEAVLGGVALLFALFVVGVSLALAAAETRDERDVLDIVGASPAVIRRTSGRKAVLLTLLGVTMAIPVGFLPVVVFAGAREPNLPLVFPVRTVALLAVVVPIVVGAVTMLGSAIALRVRPVRISTMTFE